MHSAAANKPMIAPRSVIVTDGATIQHQNRIDVGFAYPTRKTVNCDLILPDAPSSAERASACSLASVFAAYFSGAEPVYNAQPASRAYQSTLRVTYITIVSTTKSAIAPMSSA